MQVMDPNATNPYGAPQASFYMNAPQLELLDQQQPEALRNLMVHIVTNNQFNAYCIDCYQRQSTHANITYGTFICEPCA